MNSTSVRTHGLALVLAGAAVLAFAGCYGTTGGGYVSTGGYVGPGPGYADYDDYVYYPGYEAYYSNLHHRYIYREGNAWVTRADPPHGWRAGAPSVRMDFHDSPEHHHADVVRTYPRTWQPRANRDRDRDRDRDHDEH